ncbi:MAG: methyltransferase domain-containing protein, partial [Stellaceae bacterium]
MPRHDRTEPTALFDRRAWRQHRERAARQGCSDFLHAEVAARIIDRLDGVNRRFHAALDLGSHSGALSRALAGRPGIERIIAADPAIGFLTPPPSPAMRVAADPELLPFRDAGFDLAVSALVLHWVGDLPGTLIQLRRALVPDGLFLGAMLGGATLAELRSVLIDAELAETGGASPRVSPTADLADAAALLQRAGFAMPVADADQIAVTYPHALALMRELRAMGETNALSARPRTALRRATLTRATQLYAERFGRADGRVTASFEVLFLTGWAPAAGQPQPLRPGSAAHRLADALGTVEISAGDRAAPPTSRSSRCCAACS